MTVATNGPPVLNGSAFIYPSKTLAELRTDLLALLGFADPLTNIETQTLVYLRETLIRRLGLYYIAGSNPGGVDELIDSFINEAQQTLFRTLELDQGDATPPALMTADGDLTELDYVPVLALALGLAKAHYGQADAKAYFEQLAKYLQDYAARRPPNIVAMCNKWLQRAQFQLYTRYSILRTERWWKIPIVQGERVYDVPSISSGELTVVAFVSGTPATITRSTGSWLTDGFRDGYRIKATGSSVSGNNNVQWTIDTVTATTITLITGDTVTSDPAGDTVTITTANYMSLDFRTVSQAWLQDSETWLPLEGGIPASMFNITQETIPSRFEMREYFEIFPAPNKAYTAWIKGHFGLLPFEADTDVTTIDSEAIFLQALTWAKAHFRQPDAPLVLAEMDKLVGQLNAGAFAGMRYIPNQRPQPQAYPYPQTTFARP